MITHFSADATAAAGLRAAALFRVLGRAGQAPKRTDEADLHFFPAEAQRLQQLLGVGAALGVDGIVLPGADGALLHDAGPAEDLHVVGKCGLGDLQFLQQHGRVLGIDICGRLPEHTGDVEKLLAARRKNIRSSKMLYDFIERGFARRGIAA